MSGTSCPTTKTANNPPCTAGVASAWYVTATCDTPPCSAVDFNGKPVTGCTIPSGEVEPNGQVDKFTGASGATCPPTVFNCNCVPPANPLLVKLTSDADFPIHVREIDADTGTKGGTLCMLMAKSDTCTVGTDFIATGTDSTGAEQSGDPFNSFIGPGDGWKTTKASYTVAPDPAHPGYLSYTSTTQRQPSK